jgi:hypothetical protein
MRFGALLEILEEENLLARGARSPDWAQGRVDVVNGRLEMTGSFRPEVLSPQSQSGFDVPLSAHKMVSALPMRRNDAGAERSEAFRAESRRDCDTVVLYL